MKYIAYTVSGLEQIAIAEISEKASSASIVDVSTKRIILEGDLSFSEAKSLKTIDDLGVLIFDGFINHPGEIALKIKYLDFISIRTSLSQFRNIKNTFSITIAGVGWKGFNYENEIRQIAKEVEQRYTWEYTPRDHTNFDIRIFIDNHDLFISGRVTEKSLHEREYKKLSKQGSLKSTIAAAMVELVKDNQKSQKIVDTFCGSGTILCEAFIEKNEVYGSDIDIESVDITNKNLKNLGFYHEDRLKIQNATKTNWQSNYFDCAVSNFPWDKQIKVESITNLYEGALKEYKRILKTNGKLCVLLTKPEIFVKQVKKYFPQSTIKKYPISYIGQTPTIILIKNS